MGMGIVNDNDFELEKNRLNIVPSKSNEAIINDIESGRGLGNVQVPDSLRKIIGETSEINGRVDGLALANQFGISPSSVSAYANGSTSTKSYDKTPNKSHINEAKLRVSNRARNRLMQALHNITPEKLASSKATECAGIAKDMSVIIKNMEPESQSPNGGVASPTFVFFAPQPIREDTFDVIYSKE